MVNIWSFFDHIIGSCCPLCRAPGPGICAGCLADLPRNDHPCRRCALPLPVGAPPGSECADCQGHPPSFDAAVAPLLYQAPVDELVAGFKYHHRLDLGRVLADRLTQAVVDSLERPQLLLPVPMDRRSLAGRGFNQTVELTARLSRRLEIPWAADLLYRPAARHQQRGLGRRARLRNIRGSFRVDGRLPGHVAIVDDVVTTGATVEELAKTLRRAGVDRVAVWAVARTPREEIRR